MAGGSRFEQHSVDRVDPLHGIPRADLLVLPTPLVALRRLSNHLGGPRILMKRDDLTGLALGGNKTRKLEFLIGEALGQGCDAVVTGGAGRSNHCRQTSAAAAAAGLACHLALSGESPEVPYGNLLLDGLFGATVHWCGTDPGGAAIAKVARRLRAEGRLPYVIPYGGSNEVGALGFVAAVGELKQQLEEADTNAESIVVSSSSGGTHAGLAVGVDLYGLSTRVIGIGIDRGAPGEPPYEGLLATLADRTAARIGMEIGYGPSDFHMDYDYFGEGYGVVGATEREAIELVGRLEGILLDPVYTARAMGALIDMIRHDRFVRDGPVVFWHTGGAPTIFDYARQLGG